MLKVAILGAGNVGRIRARVIQGRADCRVVMVVDVDQSRAHELARPLGAEASTDSTDAILSPNVDALVVSTPTKFHAEATRSALQNGKHVLCEKPLARSVAEAEEMVSAAECAQRVLKTGFNYRHMAHVRKAKEFIDQEVLGPLYFVRCIYGHGGRPGYETSWCTDQELSGGGVLLEQGIHMLDLVRHLFGEPLEVLAQAPRFFWNFPAVEDNCFLLLRSESSQIAQVHVSWTQWVNTFLFEIFGHDGYLRLTGRDGHYGPQRLVWGKRNENHSRPKEEVFDFPGPDDSWQREWSEFLAAVRTRPLPMGSAEDGLRALHLVEAAYQSSQTQEWVTTKQAISQIGSER